MRTRKRNTGAEDAVRAVLLAEYEALKAEQKSRIALRDRLVYTALAALAATLALALQPVERPHLVLLLPLVCVVLGWTHLANDQKITAIGAYLRGEVAPVLAHRAGPLANLLSWETHHRASRYRRVDKCAQLAVDLLAFAVPSLLATAFYWTSGDVHPALFAGSILEALVTLALGTRVILAADLTP
ncbi:hypothetical protein [Actinokineospora bangkokensis]|uniref:Integral membrane protein n=1 Tax=Actinokineospora bangkokensis TaxID=1193682 RepID=A0A1Q9LSY0_9PSEU|nr:hypothetical protein [Actinokineospora bangkokensis]OLR95119.1 hypothetical protein BJP25_09040 [Actinokineospora bangkokensis]